jgi:hypothetical protein
VYTTYDNQVQTIQNFRNINSSLYYNFPKLPTRNKHVAVSKIKQIEIQKFLIINKSTIVNVTTDKSRIFPHVTTIGRFARSIKRARSFCDFIS